MEQLHSVPEDVLVNIFSYLSVKQRTGIQRVCKQWHRLSLCGVKRVLFHINSNGIRYFDRGFNLAVGTCNRIDKVLENCPNVDTIGFNLARIKLTEKCAIRNIAHRIADVKRLEIANENGKCRDSLVIQLTEKMSKIEELSYDFNSSKLAFEVILKQNRNIKKLLICYSKSLLFDFELMPPLEELCVSGSTLNYDFFKVLSVRSKETLAKLDLPLWSPNLTPDICCQISSLISLKVFRGYIDASALQWLKLETLEVLKLSLYGQRAFDTVAVIKQFIKNNRSLKVLQLGSIEASDDLVESICDSCHQLEFVSLMGGKRVTKRTLDALATLPNLEGICIGCAASVISDEEMAEFVQSSHLCVLKTNDLTSLYWIQTIYAFVMKAMSNPSQRFYFHASSINMENEPRNLYRFVGYNAKTDSRQLSFVEFESFIQRRYFRCSTFF